MLMLKYWIVSSAKLACSNQIFGGGALYFLAPSIIAALNSSQVAEARAVIGDTANIAPITNIRMRMKRPASYPIFCVIRRKAARAGAQYGRVRDPETAEPGTSDRLLVGDRDCIICEDCIALAIAGIAEARGR
jgi:hypothetical protein